MVGDVDSLQGLYVRGLTPPLVALAVGAACVGVTAAFLPAAAAILAVGLVLVGVLVPALTVALTRAAGRRQGAARAELTAELVELLRGAPELVVYGREEDTLARDPDAEPRARPPRPARRARSRPRGGPVDPDRRPDRRRLCLRSRPTRRSTGCSSRRLALLALASFECVTPLRAAAAELSATIAAGRRVFELVDREPSVRDPAEPRPAPAASRGRGARGRHCPLRAGTAAGAERLRPAARAGPADRARRAERRRQDDGHEPPAPLPRSGGGPCDARGPRRARAPPVRRPANVCARRTGRARLQLDDPRQPRPRAPDRDRRRARGRTRPRTPRRVGRVAPRRSGHARRRGGHGALGRPAPAPDGRAGSPVRCSGARARRADRAPRP